jgi:anti-sigma B factor antagonist
MTETSFLVFAENLPVVVASVKCEKVGAREAQIIEGELRKAAPVKKWKMVLDMSDVAVLASMGLGALVTMHKECTKGGGKLVVCGLRPDLLQLLKITHLDRVLKIVGDRDAAMKTLA